MTSLAPKNARPLQVYLDSNDFSRFGELLAGHGNPEYGFILDELERLIASGSIECRYSYIHIIEAAPISEEAVRFAVERAHAIERICGCKTLAPYMNLPLIEAVGAFADPSSNALPRDRTHMHGRNDRGEWFPSFGVMMTEIADWIRSMIEDVGRAATEHDPNLVLNRAMRRTLKKKATPKTVERDFKKQLPTIWPRFEERVRKEFPLSDEASSAWRRFCIGEVSVDKVSRAVSKDLSNLEEMMRWLAPSGGPNLRTLPSWLREGGETLMRGYTEHREQLDEINRRTEALFGKEKVRKLWDSKVAERRQAFAQRCVEMVLRSIDKERPWIQQLGVNPDEIYSLVAMRGTDVLPSQKVITEIFVGNFQKNIAPFEQRRKESKIASDIGDMMHGWYMPFVDVMRVDGFGYQYMQAAASLTETVLVDKIEKLIPTIRSILAARTAA